jgi:hypothetical protein
VRAALGLIAGFIVSMALACGSGSDSQDEAEARVNEIFLTYFDVFAGKKPPHALIDVYAAECRQNANLAEITALVDLLRSFLPGLEEANIEAVDVGGLDVRETSDGLVIQPADPAAMRFRVAGRFVDANDYLSGLIGEDASTFTTIPAEETLTLVRRNGRLYFGDCTDLQDIAS